MTGAVGAFADSKDSVVGHWNFLNIRNDTVLDLSGNNNHARLYNTKADPKGRLFKEAKDSCEVPDNEAFYLTKSFTIEAFCIIQGYIQWTSANFQNHSAILYRGDGRSGNDPYFLSVEPVSRNYDQQWLKHIRFHIESNSPVATDDIGVPADSLLNKPVYIAAVLDDAAGKMILYINGVKKAEKPTKVRPIGALVANQAPGIGLGSHPATLPGNSPYRFPFIGVMEEIRLENYAMSAQEIAKRYNEGPVQTRMWRKTYSGKTLAPASQPDKIICLDGCSPIPAQNAYTVSGKNAQLPNENMTGVFITKPMK